MPLRMDESVSRRWGVNITVGSPILQVALFVPEYVWMKEAKENNDDNSIDNPDEEGMYNGKVSLIYVFLFIYSLVCINCVTVMFLSDGYGMAKIIRVTNYFDLVIEKSVVSQIVYRIKFKKKTTIIAVHFVAFYLRPLFVNVTQGKGMKVKFKL